MQKTKDYDIVATKVSKAVSRQLDQICEKRGISKYDMLQMMCDCIVRYMSEEHNLSREINHMMLIFEHMVGWENALNLASPFSAGQNIVEATYFIQSDNKNGTRAVHLVRPFFGEWTQTENMQTILDRTIERLSPIRHQLLHAIAKQEECASLTELLDHIIDTHTNDALIQQIREEFEDASRSCDGKIIEFGNVPVRKMHFTVNSPTLFDNNEQE